MEVYQNGTFSAWNVLDVGLNALGMCASGRAAFSEGRKLAKRIVASEARQRVAVRIAKGNGSSRVLQTGGRQIDYKAYIKRLDTINREYENIRLDTTDISKIAQNTGMPEWKVGRIKEHVFFNEHILDSGLNRFDPDPDPDIADAWYRLTSGNYNQNDINLLNHEYFESKFERFYKTDYRTAHSKTVESGRVWEP